MHPRADRRRADRLRRRRSTARRRRPQPPRRRPRPGRQPDAISFRAFFFRDGALVPVTVLVPPTKAVARAALEQLLAGPRAGYQTGDPGGRRSSKACRSSPTASRPRASRASSATRPRTAQGQIVSTLTQFPTVRAVRIEVDGKPVAAPGRRRRRPPPGRDERRLRRPHPRRVHLRPHAGARLHRLEPGHAAGTATVFEATFDVEIWQGRQARRHEDDHGERRRSRARHVVVATSTCRRATSGSSSTSRRPRTARTCTRRRSCCTCSRPDQRPVAPAPDRWLQFAADRSPVAQLAERSAVNRNVVGSSPTRGAKALGDKPFWLVSWGQLLSGMPGFAQVVLDRCRTRKSALFGFRGRRLALVPESAAADTRGARKSSRPVVVRLTEAVGKALARVSLAIH